jgi:hypothetical protein
MAYFLNSEFDLAKGTSIDRRMTVGTTGTTGIYAFTDTEALKTAHDGGSITLFDGLLVVDADTHITYECVFVEGTPTFVNRSFGVNMLVFIDNEWKNQTVSTLTIEPNVFVEFKAIPFGNIKEILWGFGSNSTVVKPFDTSTSASIYDPHVMVEWTDTSSVQKNITLRVTDSYDNQITETFTVNIVPSGTPLNPFYYGLSTSNLNSSSQLTIDMARSNASTPSDFDNINLIIIPYYSIIVDVLGFAPTGNEFYWIAAPLINPVAPTYTEYKEGLDVYQLITDGAYGDKFSIIETTISGYPYMVYKFIGTTNGFGEQIGVGTVSDVTFKA